MCVSSEVLLSVSQVLPSERVCVTSLISATRPLQPGGFPAKSEKIPKNPAGERSEPEGNPAAAEWRSAGVARWSKRSRGGVSRQILMLVAGVL
jgi:hypothetical protein